MRCTDVFVDLGIDSPYFLRCCPRAAQVLLLRRHMIYPLLGLKVSIPVEAVRYFQPQGTYSVVLCRRRRQCLTLRSDPEVSSCTRGFSKSTPPSFGWQCGTAPRLALPRRPLLVTFPCTKSRDLPSLFSSQELKLCQGVDCNKRLRDDPGVRESCFVS